MNIKTAQRFLNRNKWKIAKHNIEIDKQGKSFLNRVEKCIEVIKKGEQK